jgi:hypothetical protein
MIPRSLPQLTAAALLTAACGGEAAPATTTVPPSTAAATTTEPPSTTTSTSTSTTTTTLPPTTTTTTTTVPVIPPESGFHIVDEEQYPNGVPFSWEELGYLTYSGLGAIGYMLPEGSEIHAAFDGDYSIGEGCGTAWILGVQIPYANLETNYWEDPAVESLLMQVFGEALTFSCPTEPDPGTMACWPCPVSRGDVIARVTDAHAPIRGIWSVNVLISLMRLSPSLGFMTSEGLMHEYFSFLP